MLGAEGEEHAAEVLAYKFRHQNRTRIWWLALFFYLISHISGHLMILKAEKLSARLSEWQRD